MRLFIAVEISEEIKREIVKITDKFKEAGADVKWVRPEGMHLTLKFLGEVDETRKDKIVDILKPISKTKSPFIITFQGLGAFPDLKRPRVIWIGAEKGKEELKNIAEEIEGPLSEMGFSKEKREFSPHLTLGRVKSNRGIKELVSLLTGCNDLILSELNADKISLIQSILKREGSEYKSVVSCNLCK